MLKLNQKSYKFIFIFTISLLWLLVGFFLIFIIQTLKTQKQDVYPYIIDQKLLKTPYLNNSLKYFYEPIASSNDSFAPPEFNLKFKSTINKDSLNERIDYSIKKGNNTIRIITLGDSYTYGAFVNTSQNYPEQLENLLTENTICNDKKHFDVINLGVYGYDIKYAIERFKLRGQKYKPNLVIWLLNKWQMDTINEYYYPLEQKLVSEDKSAISRETKSRKAGLKAHEEMTKNLGRKYILDQNITLLTDFAKEFEGQILFVGISKMFAEEFRDEMTSIIKFYPNTLYLPFIFNTPIEAKYIFPDSHPNQLGYKIIAGKIYDFLLTNVYHSCTSNK